MTDANSLDIDAIRARMEAAASGPWEFRPRRGFQMMSDNPATIGFVDTAGYFVMLREGTWATEADMEFIAHARTDIPLLLAALDEEVARSRAWDKADRLAHESLLCERDEARAERDLLDEALSNETRERWRAESALAAVRALVPTCAQAIPGDSWTCGWCLRCRIRAALTTPTTTERSEG